MRSADLQLQLPKTHPRESESGRRRSTIFLFQKANARFGRIWREWNASNCPKTLGQSEPNFAALQRCVCVQLAGLGRLIESDRIRILALLARLVASLPINRALCTSHGIAARPAAECIVGRHRPSVQSRRRIVCSRPSSQSQRSAILAARNSTHRSDALALATNAASQLLLCIATSRSGRSAADRRVGSLRPTPLSSAQ